MVHSLRNIFLRVLQELPPIGLIIVRSVFNATDFFSPLDPGIAHGFLATYEAFCDYYKLPPSQEFIKYVHDLVAKGIRLLFVHLRKHFGFKGSTELIMDQCPGIERKTDPINFAPIRAALRHNTYFTFFALKMSRKVSSSCNGMFLTSISEKKLLFALLIHLCTI